MRRSALFVCALVAWLVSTAARAQGPLIETLEHGSWAKTIAALQVDLHSEGDRVHVRVTDGSGVPSPCGTYALTLDEAGACAFQIGECDPALDATELTLVDRSSLFDHEYAISRPRAINIFATRVEGVQAGGGARVVADSHVSCRVDVRPYLPDLENGSRVALTPNRYQLLFHDDDVRVATDSTHWILTRAADGLSSIQYEIVDRKSGEVVLRDRVALDCRHQPSRVPAPEVREELAVREPLPKPWNGKAMSISFLPGVGVLRPGGLKFQNDGGSISAADLGLRDVAGAALGLTVAYERPWFFASLAFNTAIAPVGERTLYEIGGSTTVGSSIHVGPCGIYLGANFGVSSYMLTGLRAAQLEWRTDPEFGFGIASGLRVHLRSRGAAMGVLGLDVAAPIVGHQPWLVVAAFGGGFGH